MAAIQTKATEYTMFLIHTDFGWPANLGIALNYVIYYQTNVEYRKAFQSQLSWLLRRPIGVKNKRVGPTYPSQISIVNSK